MHSRLSVHSVCFPTDGIRQLAGHLREIGAHRVSLASYLLFQEGLPAAQEALAASGCSVESLTHPFMAGSSTGGHLDTREESWRQPRETLGQVIRMAQTLGARSVYMLSGGRGSLTWEEAADVFRQAIAPCVQQARDAGVALLVENSSPLYAEIHIAHTLRDTVTLAEIADVGVCMDFFACWTEAGLRESIRRAMPRCHLVQVCDYAYGDRALPSRAVPGDGAIPVPRMLDWVLKAGYAGTFDIELVGPRIELEGPVNAVRRAATAVGAALSQAGCLS
jgi:sugar phosphate isomerase/epimerase